MNEILLKHKDFIYAVAMDLISPNKSNDIVKEILEAYNSIDATAEVLSECATCTNIYKDTFKIILAYLNQTQEVKTKNTKK
jgi:hypothetical protein